MDQPARARLRVSLESGEVEVEGSEAFVGRYSEQFETLLSRLSAGGPMRAPTERTRTTTNGSQLDDVSAFPEALHQFASKSGTDQILLASAFAARNRPDGVFTTADANSLLVEQGIKLANPSQSMANNLKAKRVFKSGKNWKISRTGEEYLGSLGVTVRR